MKKMLSSAIMLTGSLLLGACNTTLPSPTQSPTQLVASAEQLITSTAELEGGLGLASTSADIMDSMAPGSYCSNELSRITNLTRLLIRYGGDPTLENNFAAFLEFRLQDWNYLRVPENDNLTCAEATGVSARGVNAPGGL